MPSQPWPGYGSQAQKDRGNATQWGRPQRPSLVASTSHAYHHQETPAYANHDARAVAPVPQESPEQRQGLPLLHHAVYAPAHENASYRYSDTNTATHAPPEPLYYAQPQSDYQRYSDGLPPAGHEQAICHTGSDSLGPAAMDTISSVGHEMYGHGCSSASCRTPPSIPYVGGTLYEGYGADAPVSLPQGFYQHDASPLPAALQIAQGEREYDYQDNSYVPYGGETASPVHSGNSGAMLPSPSTSSSCGSSTESGFPITPPTPSPYAHVAHIPDDNSRGGQFYYTSGMQQANLKTQGLLENDARYSYDQTSPYASMTLANGSLANSAMYSSYAPILAPAAREVVMDGQSNFITPRMPSPKTSSVPDTRISTSLVENSHPLPARESLKKGPLHRHVPYPQQSVTETLYSHIESLRKRTLGPKSRPTLQLPRGEEPFLFPTFGSYLSTVDKSHTVAENVPQAWRDNKDLLSALVTDDQLALVSQCQVVDHLKEGSGSEDAKKILAHTLLARPTCHAVYQAALETVNTPSPPPAH